MISLSAHKNRTYHILCKLNWNMSHKYQKNVISIQPTLRFARQTKCNMHKPHFHPQFFDVLQISNFDITNIEVVIFCILLKISDKGLISCNSIYSFMEHPIYSEEYSIPKLFQ